MKTNSESFSVAFLNPYTADNGTQMFLYAITAITPELLARYKALKGDHYAERDGKPLFHTSKPAGPVAKAVFYTDKNGSEQTIIDDSDIIMFKSLVQEHGIDMAKIMMPEFGKVPA